MKLRLLALLLFLVGMCGLPTLQASHIHGADITYSCLNSYTTRVHLRNYRDCTGAFVIGNAVYWNSAGCAPPVPLGGWSPQHTTELTMLCPTASTQCTTPGAPIYGVQEYYWYRDYDICAVPPCIFELFWMDCCRNPSITALANPGSAGVTVGTVMNTALGGCNNSPQFLYPPAPYLFAGEYASFSLACEDADGDSLSYVLGPCRFDSTTYVSYGPGYSPSTPMGPSWQVTVNPSSGLLEFFPQPGNLVIGVICVAVLEWRNGALIGTTERDFMYTVINSPNNETPVLAPIQNVSGNAMLVGDDLYLCGPSTVCFDVTGADADPSQLLDITWTENLPGAVFHQLGNPSVVDSIPGTSGLPPVGHFCWMAPAIGHYTVGFQIRDNACPLRAFTQRSINIHVGGVFGVNASANLGLCPTVNFSSTACGPGPYTYAWSGAGGFSSTLSHPTYNFPGPGSYPWQLIATNGTVSDTVVDTIVIPYVPIPQNLLTGSYYVWPCFGITYDTLAPTGSWNSYQWSTGDTTNFLSVSIQGNYSVTVTNNNGCPFTDDATVVGQSPDIEGFVSTSTGAPLIDQKVYLVLYDTLLQALYALDSIQTDNMGYYFFCNVSDTIVFVKAAPDSADYPTQMPTYADSSLFWSGALQLYPLLQSPIRLDFSTKYGANPGGPGFIGGLILQGANKVNAPGDPMPGVRVMLRNATTGEVLGFRDTDVNGHFSFGNLPLGDYEIVPDLYPRSVTNVPFITLDAQHPVMDSLDFRMHWTWLELVVPTGVPFVADVTAQVAPNPFGGRASLLLELPGACMVGWELYDELGRKVQGGAMEEMGSGRHVVELGGGLPQGLYLLHLSVGGEVQQLRLVKTH